MAISSTPVPSVAERPGMFILDSEKFLNEVVLFPPSIVENSSGKGSVESASMPYVLVNIALTLS